ncbi:MAG: hypothetical protein RI964_1574 [Pseudomonadota bacterium]|jgi:short-subunit dehydrogenase
MPLNHALFGKHIVITGGNGGIGQLLVGLLKEQGARVTIIDRSKALDTPTLLCNLADTQALDALCQTLANQPVDVLVNLAGLMYFGHFPEQSAQALANLLMVNLQAPLRLAQAVIPGMLARGEGQIVNIGSVFGSLAFPHFTAYSASKAGLKAFSEALRREYAGKGISVTHIIPRAVKTPMNNAVIKTLHQRTQVKSDPPELVAAVIVDAIVRKRKQVTIGQPEGFFTQLNAVFPSIIDNALVSKRDIADEILASQLV